jgi:formiminoglutamate deiminase
MYAFAEKLDPACIYDLSRLAYAELALAGVTAVGEFHYVHHQPDGTPYDDRIAMADAVVRAARDVGLRICLLRVLYNRAGKDRPAEGAQKRFSDPKVEDALDDIAALAKRHSDDPGVTVGLAPHSIRAVPREWIREAHALAEEGDMPFHMHVAEQRRELEECVAEHGMPPVRVLAEDGVLTSRFVAVHATHLEDDEVRALGDAEAFACICRTTERDLGDGAVNAAALMNAGVRLCTGVDSHAISDPFEEARAIELDDRTRAEGRVVAAEAPELLRAACENGYGAIGMEGAETLDRVALDASDAALLGAPDDQLADAVVFAASPRTVSDVNVGGRSIVWDGEIPDWHDIRKSYETAIARLTN